MKERIFTVYEKKQKLVADYSQIYSDEDVKWSLAGVGIPSSLEIDRLTGELYVVDNYLNYRDDRKNSFEFYVNGYKQAYYGATSEILYQEKVSIRILDMNEFNIIAFKPGSTGFLFEQGLEGEPLHFRISSETPGTVRVFTSDGTAQGGLDYRPIDTVVSTKPKKELYGDQIDYAADFSIELYNDRISEDRENFFVNLEPLNDTSLVTEPREFIIQGGKPGRFITHLDPLNETSSVYRFYNYRKGTHFFTNDTSERDTLQSNGYRMGYRYEGVAYQALSEGGTQLYRFYNASKGYHFLTSSEAEANNVISNSVGENYDVLTGQRIEPTKGGWGYQYEGRAFRVSTEQSDNTPTEIYRFYHQENGVHFYSASLDEVRNVITMSSGTQYANDLDAAMNAPLKDGGWGYQFEGTAWFV